MIIFSLNSFLFLIFLCVLSASIVVASVSGGIAFVGVRSTHFVLHS